jgi:thiamine-phosphate pyrophosphorylase
LNKGKIYRIIDANLNRAREGLRVIEDWSRFIFNDKTTAPQLKKMRHELSRVTTDIYPELIGGRDSTGDIGASPKENKRPDSRSVLIANFRRVEEAVRVLEEFSKIISAEAGYKFKKIRFRMYTIEKKMIKKVQ